MLFLIIFGTLSRSLYYWLVSVAAVPNEDKTTANSAPDTPRTMDSSSLGARVARTRRNQYDAGGVLACARRRSDVDRCNVIER